MSIVEIDVGDLARIARWSAAHPHIREKYGLVIAAATVEHPNLTRSPAVGGRVPESK